MPNGPKPRANDAYQEYVARKRSAEAMTLEITVDLPTLKRPPTMCLDIGSDEHGLRWWQWMVRIPYALIGALGIVGIPYLFPPGRSGRTRREIYQADSIAMSGGGGGTRVSIAPQQIEEIRKLVAEELQRSGGH